MSMFAQGRGGAGKINLHRVIDDKIDRHERLDNFGLPPNRCTALRIAARSTTSGTPVKSWSTIRATTKGISAFAGDFGFQSARFSTSLRPTFLAVAISEHRFEDDPDADRQP